LTFFLWSHVCSRVICYVYLLKSQENTSK
jgi:hypothetical protein